jgi:two-component system phosphate regulon sensor histidine kinase PhoR
MLANWNFRLKLTLAYVTLAIVCTCALGFVGLRLQEQTYRAHLRERLSAEAELAASFALDGLAAGSPLTPIAHQLSAATNARVTIIDPHGRIMADSSAAPEVMENHAGRPEVRAALEGRRGEDSRVSVTTGEAHYYVAVPMRRPDELAGALRLAVPLTEIDAALRQILAAVVGLTALGASLTALLTLAVTRMLTVPLRELTAFVRRAATGHFTERLPVRSRDELGLLAESFNQMSGELDRMIRAISDQRNEMQAILSGLTDAILIVDSHLHIQRINEVALALFGTTEERAQGRPLIEVTRDHELVALVGESLRTGQTQRQVIERSTSPRVLSVISAPLATGALTGALLTLHDVTELRRLEQIRRQFVANISHELRTPLSNVKLMVETLQEDPTDVALVANFLDRINAELDSLTQMVRELLELSRLESGQAPMRLEWQPLDGLIFHVIDRLRPQAERQGVTLIAGPGLVGLPPVSIDRERMEGVLVNLLHNAIKFTPPGGSITVGGAIGDGEVRLWVADTGIGIPPDELPRVFERFYKVDKARSTGGSGLGLAIVKHTVQAHGGHVWAESQLGAGSTFNFTLPLSPRPAPLVGAAPTT